MAQVRLRPVAEADLELLERMFADPEAMSEFNWHGWQDPWRWRRKWQENGLLGEGRWVLMVETLAGEVLGFVSWSPYAPGTPYVCWEMGITLLPAARGQGYGTEAQRQLVRYLFANTQMNRVQAFTDVDNIPEQRALEKAGFTREGVLRGIGFRNGTWHDDVIYGVLRAEVPLD